LRILPARLPTNTAIAATTHGAAVAATKMVSGALYLAASAAFASWVRSPHSAVKTTTNTFHVVSQNPAAALSSLARHHPNAVAT